jgi:hypothetical protein
VRLIRRLVANDVDFVDVIEILDQDRHHLTSWVHLNREANQRVAEALAERILARGAPG